MTEKAAAEAIAMAEKVFAVQPNIDIDSLMLHIESEYGSAQSYESFHEQVFRAFVGRCKS